MIDSSVTSSGVYYFAFFGVLYIGLTKGVLKNDIFR